jgi:chromosome segregation ATPase
MENMQLLQDQRDANNKLNELESEIARLNSTVGMLNATQSVDETNCNSEYTSDLEKSNAELKSRVQELQDYSNAYAEEKQSLIENIEKYEEDLSMVESLLKSKSDELDDTMFSLDKERESWLNEKKNLVEKMNGADQSLPTADYQGDIDSSTKVNESLREKINILTNEAKDLNQRLHYEHEDRAKVNEVMEENEKLVAEQLRLTNDNNEYMQGISELSDQFVELRQQLKSANENAMKRTSIELDGLKAENTLLRAESRHLTNEFADCRKKMTDLSNVLLATQQQLRCSRNGEESSKGRLVKSETEKSELTERLNAAHVKNKELHSQISVITKELKIQEKAKAQLCSSVSRVHELVDALSSENSVLKGKNDSLERARECLQNRSLELQHLLSAVSKDRDNLMESNANLSSKFRMLSYERDEAIRDKERVKANLDKIAANFEAGELH